MDQGTEEQMQALGPNTKILNDHKDVQHDLRRAKQL